MQSESLDILEKTQLPLNQARAILQAMELEFTAREIGFCTRAELKDAVHSLELKIEAVRNDLSAKIELEVRAVMRWMVSCMLAQMAFMAGALYFGLTHIRP